MEGFNFHTSDALTALLVMLLGMVGIFAVMLVIMLCVKLLNKYAKDKKSDDNVNDNSKKS